MWGRSSTYRRSPARRLRLRPPLFVSRDFDFGDQPLGEYDPALVPFLDDETELQENELAGFMFGDTANHGPGEMGRWVR